MQIRRIEPGEGTYPEAWARALASPPGSATTPSIPTIWTTCTSLAGPTRREGARAVIRASYRRRRIVRHLQRP